MDIARLLDGALSLPYGFRLCVIAGIIVGVCALAFIVRLHRLRRNQSMSDVEEDFESDSEDDLDDDSAVAGQKSMPRNKWRDNRSKYSGPLSASSYPHFRAVPAALSTTIPPTPLTAGPATRRTESIPNTINFTASSSNPTIALDSAVGTSEFSTPAYTTSDFTKALANQPPSLFISTPDESIAQFMDLPERYEIIEEISTGGMGVIYKGRHRMTGANLAIKVLHPQLATSKNHLRRFEQEARATTTLHHPNIVVVHDFGITSRAVPFLVMEWLNGPTLEKVLNQDGPLDLQRFLNVSSQCAGALAHSHKKGVIHRDIKPSNIVLVSDHDADFPKIVDFGIAKLLSETDTNLTQSGDILGSPLFMSPEQCCGDPMDQRSDVYSLGCVMYEAIVGQPVFVATHSAQIFYKQMYEMPLRPSEIRPNLELPDIIEPILFRALQKEPAHRYQSMQELEAELKQVRALIGAITRSAAQVRTHPNFHS